MTGNENASVVDEWISNQSEVRRETLRALRSLILGAGYEFEEGVKWGTPHYYLPKVSRRTICYLACQKENVRLGFFNGASLSDPYKMIEGTGKKLRHIKVAEVNSSNRDALVGYIRAATELSISNPDTLSM